MGSIKVSRIRGRDRHGLGVGDFGGGGVSIGRVSGQKRRGRAGCVRAYIYIY